MQTKRWSSAQIQNGACLPHVMVYIFVNFFFPIKELNAEKETMK